MLIWSLFLRNFRNCIKLQNILISVSSMCFFLPTCFYLHCKHIRIMATKKKHFFAVFFFSFFVYVPLTWKNRASNIKWKSNRQLNGLISAWKTVRWNCLLFYWSSSIFKVSGICVCVCLLFFHKYTSNKHTFEHG